MDKRYIWLVMVILLICFVNATTITDNGITITSDKDTYYCEPVFIGDSCLIKARIDVTNENAFAINLDGLSTFSTSESITNLEYKTSSGSPIPQKAQDAIPQELFLGGETKSYYLSFFTSESGKFNYSVNLYQLGNLNLIATTVLDPFYNITINSSTPSYLLTYGVCMNESINEFESKTDITTGLSDGLDVTHYKTYFASMPYLTNYIINGWSFNEYIFDNKLYSFSGDLDGIIFGNLDSITIDDQYGDYYGGYFDGVNDYVRFSIFDQMDIADLGNLTICVAFNTTFNAGGDIGVISKGEINGDGIFMRYKLDETIDCEFDGDTGSVTVSSNIVDDNILHTICCVKSGDTVNLWQDGVLTDTASGNIGKIINSNDLYFGSRNLGINKFEGTIRQIGIFNVSLNNTILSSMGNDRSIADFNKGQSIHVYFNHSIVSNINNLNYLAIQSDVLDLSSIRVMSYINATHPNSSNFLTERITSGISYIQLDSLLPTGYNFPLRVWNLEGRIDELIDEIYLVTSINDSTNPSINDCQVNTTSLGCDGIVKLQCNVTDDGDIHKVYFDTNFSGVLYSDRANNDNGIFYVEKTLSGEYNESKELVWYLANATDLGGNVNLTSLNISVNYTCLSNQCVPNWQQDINICQINDSILISYTDTNACGVSDSLPLDNGTWTSCNYCSQDLEIVYSECQPNATRNASYVDNNFFSCCAITNISSDCDILTSPYNETTEENCVLVNNSMNCDTNTFAEFGYFDDKIYWVCEPNLQSGNCMSYVVDLLDGVIQVNPQKKGRAVSFISLKSDTEDRTSFDIENGLVNVFFTNENMVFDKRSYAFKVVCSDGNDTYEYTKFYNPEYENVKAPITRWLWIKDNLVGLAIGLIGIIFFVGLFGLMIREVRRR